MPPSDPSAFDAALGQHIHLSVAAHLARTQLVKDPKKLHDAEHLFEMLDVVARALTKAAPLYVCDDEASAPRALGADEVERASLLRGGQSILLADGRRFTRVSMKRSDLRAAIALLKVTGVPGIAPPQAKQSTAVAPAQSWKKCVAELNALLRPPLESPRIEEANRILIALARHGKGAEASNVAMRLMSEVNACRGAALSPAARELLAALHTAIPA